MQVKLSKTLAVVTVCSVLVLGEPVRGQQTLDEDIQTQAEGDRSALLTLKLKDRLLTDVVPSIRRKAGVNIIMDERITDETVTIDVEDVEWRLALDLVVEAAGCIVVEVAGNVLKVEKPPRVYFAFENADIQKVIDTIAKISGANIVVAPEVRGNITLRLKNIPWRDALEAAVKTLGFVVVEEDRGILRVVPASNMQEDLVVKTFQLRYVRPKSSFIPLLSSQYVRDLQATQQMAPNAVHFSLIDALRRMLTPNIGTLEYFEGINVVVVKDTKPVVDQIKKIVEKIDIEPAQVFIDVKFVTTSNEDILEYGISPGGNGWTTSVGLGQIPTRLPFNLGAGGFDDEIIANDLGIGPFADELLNPSGDTIVPDVVFGALDMTQMTATLRLLKKDSSSEIVQSPKLIALDHTSATIFVGEAVRYAQSRVEQGQAGGLLLALEEGDDSPVNVGFQLLVTPHVVPGTDKVILDIIPQRTALTGTGATGLAPAGFDVFTVGAAGSAGSIALPRVGSSTIATKVLLRSNQTAVLGGLVTRNQTETVTKIPLLGDIPILGFLFKHVSQQDTRTTLIVFITPSVIRSPEDVESSVRTILQDRWLVRERMLEEQRQIFGIPAPGSEDRD
jgi:type IV pilus assembly protein PilQ